jgi:hypothetical protein
MSGNGLKACMVVSGGALSLCLGFFGVKAQSSLQQPLAPSGAPPKLAQQQFKNIHALNGVPADQVVPSMQFIAASLGVECEYCHVHGAMEKDDKKPKVTARKMIAMMMAINKDNFENRREVTCFSCHRGTKDPVATPIISDEEAKPENGEGKKPGEGRPAFPAGRDLLDKYPRFGTRRAKNLDSLAEGNVTFGGERFPVSLLEGPDVRLSRTSSETASRHLTESEMARRSRQAHIMSRRERRCAPGPTSPSRHARRRCS